MIITRAMPTQQTAITGVSRRITAGQEIKPELCRGPGFGPASSSTRRHACQPAESVGKVSKPACTAITSRRNSVGATFGSASFLGMTTSSFPYVNVWVGPVRSAMSMLPTGFSSLSAAPVVVMLAVTLVLVLVLVVLGRAPIFGGRFAHDVTSARNTPPATMIFFTGHPLVRGRPE